jgi:hypothetical protein
MLRGRPTQGAAFDWNVVVHDDLDAAVKLKDETGWDGVFEGWDEAHSEFHFTQTGNTWDTDTTADLAVGDFDGDGLDDVFLANGTGWWYSSAGQTEWRFLRASRLRASALRFGQFDADPRTDVFSKEGDAWYFYPAATGARQLLRADATSLSDLLFGDFDGNGRTDVLWTTGSHWYIYADARGPAWWQKPSGYRAGQLRVGDFDGGGRDDVFGYVNGTWSYWRWNQTGSGWERLNGALTTSVEALAVADFDGDGRDDVAQGYNGGWRWSRSGSAAWAYIRPGGVQSEYSDVRRALLGRFNFDSLLDAIRYELVNGLPGTRFVGWDQSQPEFTSWTPAVHHR